MTYREFLEQKIDVAPLSGLEVDESELNPDYFRDGVGYLQEADEAGKMFTLFDLAGSL